MRARRQSGMLRPLLLACLLTLSATAVAAKDINHKPYALIFGTVYRADDRPAQGVKVKIRRAEDKKARWELVSDRRGEFAQRVPAGKADYLVWADIKGNNPKPEVKVHVENDERVDIGLHLTE
ncbi:MAG TPA: hypothetical protein VGQ71_10105 [Terriglobales bacterium]|nr:hypothetical protein [Terriglobales bacterium]